MPKLIPNNQFAFMEGRFIVDNTLVAQEILCRLQTTKPKDALLALNIDLQKAYDRIN